MSTNFYLNEDEIQKAISMLFLYNQTYALGAPILRPNPSVCAYYNSLDNEDWLNIIIGSGYRYGSLSKKQNILRISFTGLFTNIFNLIDGLRMEFDQSFYGIPTFISSTLFRVYAELHHQIQNVLLLNPQIDKIQIIGHSYGTAIVQSMAILFHKLLLFHKTQISLEGHNTISSMYLNYLGPHISNYINLNRQDPLSKAITTKVLLENIQQQSFTEVLQSFDRDLFSRIELESVHAFAPLNILPEFILNDKDLGLLQSASNLNLGILNKNEFFNKVRCYVLPNDPVAGIFDRRTLFGKIVSMCANGQNRILLGQVIVLKPTSIFPAHEYAYYVESLSRSLIDHDSLKIDSYITAPVCQPLPITVMPYIGITAVQSGNPFVVLLGILMLLVGITVPLLGVLVIYLIISFILGLQPVGS